MKWNVCTILILTSSLFLLNLSLVFPVKACGPYVPIIPTPNFFTSMNVGKTKSVLEKEHNLHQWQQLTSESIPIGDIEEAVYQDSYKKMYETFCYPHIRTENKFYNFLLNANDWEIIDFLLIAKGLEELRFEYASPWYYPSSRTVECFVESDGSAEERERNGALCVEKSNDIQYFIKAIKAYKGTRLQDRYGLQMVRALFASHQYATCIEFYDSAFSKIRDANLFKGMALSYIAGCWMHLGNKEKANKYFVKTGDLWSLQVADPIAYMAEKNPDAIGLLEYLQESSSDSAKMCSLKPIAEQVLKNGKVKSRGDWEFALAYIYGEYQNNYKKAGHHIRKSLQSSFSSKDLRDHAIAYRMKCDAANGISSHLLSDLEWFEKKINLVAPDANEWNRMLQNIIYMQLVPRFWKDKDYATAILLCGYADNMYNFKQNYFVSIPEKRKNEELFNSKDYGNLSFQLMGSIESSQLIDVYHKIATKSPLYNHLKKYARTDADYINELIGTLALREENYKRAIVYFSKVSEKYQRTMNVYKRGYLFRNPFEAYPNQKSGEDYRKTIWEKGTRNDKGNHSIQIKLRFASEMYCYQQIMRKGKTKDERGLARLRYAIGRRNSFEGCWALTQYWRGECILSLFYPLLQYWDDAPSVYSFLYDYERNVGHDKTEKLYNRECQKAMAMLSSDKAKAEAEYLLYHLRTIIKRYPNTPIARKIKSSCDNWYLWL